jgi:hypothetical protein
MFTVEGYVGRTAYTAVVGQAPDQRPPDSDVVGVTAGSPSVLAVLEMNDGDMVRVTPTGPTITLDVNDPESVYGALLGLTEVVTTTGEVPDILGPREPGAVY